MNIVLPQTRELNHEANDKDTQAIDAQQQRAEAAYTRSAPRYADNKES